MEGHGIRVLLTTGEVARLFRVDQKTVIRWADSGQFARPIRTPTGRLRWYEDEVLAIRDRWQAGAAEDSRGV